MIYAKIPNFHHVQFLNECFRPLEECQFKDDDVFYHHHYNEQQNNIKIYECVEEAHWEHLRNNKSVKLFHENFGETFSHKFVKEVEKLISLRQVDPTQVYIGVMDEVHRQFLTEGLTSLGITGVNIGVYNFLLKKVTFPGYFARTTSKKFSALSRNYKPRRLQLYIELLKEKCLDNFNYSFFNIHPYEKTVFSVDDMLSDLQKAKVEITDEVVEWVKGVPYSLSDTDNVYNKWADVTYNAIQSADVHISIETHYDLFYYVPSPDKVYHRWLAPSFITEKVYKGIACKKPFIMFSTPYLLDDLRKLGFKTFSPFIDETYDTTTDNNARQDLIIQEIKRLSTLPADEYKKVLEGCKEIAEYNYNVLQNIKATTEENKKFDFLKQYVNPSTDVKFL